DTRTLLETALVAQRLVALEAPTGFGKTGILLETALHALRNAQCDRVVYLTSKSTGQLQVVATLQRMTAPEVCHPIGDKRPGSPAAAGGAADEAGATRLAVWH